MKTKRAAKSRISEAVYETAQDLYELGFIDKARMQTYEALCLEPIKVFDNQEIRALRAVSYTHLTLPTICSV